MIKMLSGVWALLLGVVLIMLGNGMHFTLIGLRGGIEGFSPTELAVPGFVALILIEMIWAWRKRREAYEPRETGTLTVR